MSVEIIINKYKDIIDNGEISGDILSQIIKKVGFLENLSIKSSNSSSFVLVTANGKNVYQYYTSSDTANNIFFMISKLYRNPNVTANFTNIHGMVIIKILYKITDYIVPFIRYIPGNIIVWRKIRPLNSFKPEDIPIFIRENIYKLLWDIGKAVFGLHSNYIIHCDISIDNIGIYREDDNSEYKFVLYDFDNTRKYFSFDDFRSDYYRFHKSIKYHYNLGKIPEEDVKLIDEIFYESLTPFLDSILETYMDKFYQTKIEAINNLEKLKIN